MIEHGKIIQEKRPLSGTQATLRRRATSIAGTASWSNATGFQGLEASANQSAPQ
jgi:hypothetical protein